MKRKELFKALHMLFTGKPDKVHSTIATYDKLSAKAGLKKAQEYLDWATKGQDNCQSDWAYWGFAGDKALAKVLVAVFKKLVEDPQYDFPIPPVVEEQVVMDKIHEVQMWAEHL